MESWIIGALSGLITASISVVAITILQKKNPQQTDLLKDALETRLTLNKEMSGLKEELTNRITKEYGELKTDVTTIVKTNNEYINKEINQFGQSIQYKLSTDFKELNVEVEKRLNDINKRVEDRLLEGFKQTNETFQNIAERITKIDEAQKNIQLLSSNIVDLQGVLTDKKTRGIFGEVQLKQLLVNTFGDKQQLYKMQHTYSNGKTVDAVVFAPDPIGALSIDSKFPLENYNRMVDMGLADSAREAARKQFKIDVKNHINAISEKYIIVGETADQAIMFLPAEAVFAEINAYHYELVEYAQSKKVAMTSPTTLLSILTIVEAIVLEAERNKHSKEMQLQISKLAIEFDRFKNRWSKLNRDIDAVANDVKLINTTSDKITKSFDSIASVQLPQQEEDEEPAALIDSIDN
jgi:DNA recombination protein RmuC